MRISCFKVVKPCGPYWGCAFILDQQLCRLFRLMPGSFGQNLGIPCRAYMAKGGPKFVRPLR